MLNSFLLHTFILLLISVKIYSYLHPMKTLGLIGGISWVSTIDYYRYINLGINDKLGGLNYAQCIIYSFNYADIKKSNDSGDLEGTLQLLLNACSHLKDSGAEAIVLCANTMHMFAGAISAQVQLPVIHIAEATAYEISRQNLRTVGLLGTKFTMEKDFFKEKLSAKNINTIIPDEEDRNFIHMTIFDELGKGIVLPATAARYISIINDLIARGAQGIILGCTEIPLLIGQKDIAVPAFDTTRIHADAAVAFALG
jgi:aspartate racemase